MEKLSYDIYHLARAEIQQLNTVLSNAEMTNQQKAEYREKINEYNLKLQTLQNYRLHMEQLVKGAMIKVEQYRNECISALESRVENILALIMPEEQFRVQITFRSVRGKYRSEVLIGKEVNGTIEWSPPRTQNGDFIKQLVSCSIVWSINLLLGASFIFMDEPFSSSDQINVGNLSPVFEMMIDSGMEIVMIEHKPELYQHMTHNEISLLKHRHPSDDFKGFVEVISCEPKDPLESEDSKTSEH